jgi:hypothetical protein
MEEEKFRCVIVPAAKTELEKVTDICTAPKKVASTVATFFNNEGNCCQILASKVESG